MKLIGTTLLALACTATSIQAARPNVIIVMTDDQGYGELSCHGNPVVRTPHLDRLHSQSVRFTDFHVAPMCTPTRGQLLTGLDAFRNGAMNVSSGRTLLRAGLPTMADIFTDNDYQTGMFGKWHLGDNFPFRPQDRGFQETLWFPSSHINSTPDFWDNDYFDDTYFHNGTREVSEGYCTDVFFDEAMSWMKERAEGGEPFFAYIPLNSAHWPWFVPDKYRGPVRERLAAAESRLLTKLTPNQRAALISYLAMIENIDDNMGRLEAFLKASGLRENTVLIFLTDNGSTMGPRYFNAGMRGKKVTLWEGGHRVPLFVRWPGGNFGVPRDIAELTHVQDLLPTLIDVCDFEPPADAQFDGVSLSGLLTGDQESLADRMLVVNYSRMPFKAKRPGPTSGATPRRDGAAVLWKRWRLLEDKALYNIDDDPAQQRNVIADHPEIAKKMSAHLDQWWAGVKDTVNEPSRVVIGAGAENPMMLSACEWFDVFIDQQVQVRRADLKNGIWHLSVDRAGEYEFEMRRYPRESGLAIGQAIPATKVTDGRYAPGRALDIHGARLRIGDRELKASLSPNAKAARFRLNLEKGDIELQTWFDDADGKELLGAYFVYVNRL